jgi:hypothetical protein
VLQDLEEARLLLQHQLEVPEVREARKVQKMQLWGIVLSIGRSNPENASFFPIVQKQNKKTSQFGDFVKNSQSSVKNSQSRQ